MCKVIKEITDIDVVEKNKKKDYAVSVEDALAITGRYIYKLPNVFYSCFLLRPTKF